MAMCVCVSLSFHSSLTRIPNGTWQLPPAGSGGPKFGISNDFGRDQAMFPTTLFL